MGELFINDSHIGKSIAIIKNFILLDEEFFYPLIKDFLFFKRIYSIESLKKLNDQIYSLSIKSTKNILEVINKFSSTIDDNSVITREIFENDTNLSQYGSYDNYEKLLKKEIMGDGNKNELGVPKIIKCCFLDENFKKEKTYIELVNKYIIELFNHLVISILKAEYLIFDNYSKNLIKISGYNSTKDCDILDWIQKNDDDKYEEINEYNNKYVDFNLVKFYISCVWNLLEQCKIIEHNIEKNNINRLKIINKNQKRRVETFYPFHSEIDLVPKETIRLFELAFESIIELMELDHYFYLNELNVERAILAKERINALSKKFNLDIKDYNDLTEEIYKEFKVIVDIINFKTDYFIHLYNEHCKDKSIYDPSLHLNHNRSIKSPIEKKELNILIKQFNTFEDSLKIEDLDKILINNSFLDQKRKEFVDINKYNKSSIENINVYIKTANLKILINKSKEDKVNHLDLTNSTNNIEEIYHKINELNDYIIRDPNILYEVLEFFNSVLTLNFDTLVQIKIKNHNSDKKIQFIVDFFDKYSELLKKFENIILNFEQINPVLFKPLFQNCCYTISYIDKDNKNLSNKEIVEKDIEEYKIINVKDNVYPFFWFSVGLSPLNQAKIINQCNEQKEKNFELNSKLITSIYGVLSESIETSKNNLETQNTAIASQNKKAEEQVKSFNHLIESTNKNTITILGILGAFLAFVTLTVGTISVIDNLYKYLLFSIIFIFSLFSFVLAIRFILNTKSFMKIICSSYLWIYLLICFLFYCSVDYITKNFSNQLENKQNYQKEIEKKTNDTENNFFLLPHN